MSDAPPFTTRSLNVAGWAPATLWTTLTAQHTLRAARTIHRGTPNISILLWWSSSKGPSFNGSFFYTVHGLRGTDILFAHCNYGIDPDPHRFVNLYGTAAVMQSSHPVGIVFDQHTFHAIFQPAMMDSETTMMGGRLGWLPLEMILDSFLDLLDQGKVVALPQDPALMSPTGPWKPFQAPWTMVPFSDHDLQSALFHFERLVDAIERRMPPGSVPDVPVTYGLLDAGVEEEELSGSRRMLEGQDFARRFLAGARRPRFRHIAPGLTCVDSGPQPFASLAPVDDIHTTLRPVLLARGEADAAPDFQVRKRFQEADPPIPCGLYLSETDLYCAQPFEDGCRLVLPYQLGRNGHGRCSAGTLFGEECSARVLTFVPQDLSSSNAIYQKGYNGIIKHHDTQLKHVLEWWAAMVEHGLWDVDAGGVAGGIEKWQEADSEEHWAKYVLPIHW